MESRLANIEDDGWALDDGEAIHEEFPDSFWLPPAEARHNLQPDELVKLIFRIVTVDEDEAEEENIERMWVIVKGRVGDFYRGQLDNQPLCTEDIGPGMEVWFLPKHVIDIYVNP
ncbi:DUF2314 domain-containing protein [Pseudomonas sp. S31]|uniref:hypothetical protein n=1 Tax=Pseudomonas sp. S31 TaxID=1564473 RepID=UPI00191422BB|nr:hypothetical protein [Pseudomonas sp. S31]MBK4999046.1 DUF2314 domain-containing protein [Pseudomonas sp. S31]